MSFTRTWNTAYEAIPADTEDALLGASRIRELKLDVRERFAVDHIMDETANDGGHNKVTFASLSANPAATAGRITMYARVISGDGEIHVRNGAGTVTRWTTGGRIRYEALTEMPLSVADAVSTYGRLGNANTWTATNTFQGTVNVPNATFAQTGRAASMQRLLDLAAGTSGAPRMSRGALMAVVTRTTSGSISLSGFPSDWYAVFKIWAGGGSGRRHNSSSARAGGGAGGGYIEFSRRIGDLPSSVSSVVGQGGPSRSDNGHGTAGGQSYVTIEGTRIGATGGQPGNADDQQAAGGFPFVGHVPTEAYNRIDAPHWMGGAGGNSFAGLSGVNANGRPSVQGGGGGGAAERVSSNNYTGAGGRSANGGHGGNASGNNGQIPGGGGAGQHFTGTSGAGARGEIVVEIRSWPA